MERKDASTPDWPALVLNPEFTAYVEKMARRRFGQDALAEEATDYVIDVLSEDEWARCRKYRGQSQPKTFLVSLASNLIEEFARKRFGRPRPPVWLKSQGELWVRLWRMICLERQLIPSVIDRLTHAGQRSIGTVKHAITVIKARLPTCGQEGAGECVTEDVQTWSDALGLVTDSADTGTETERQAVILFRRLISSLEADSTQIQALEEEDRPGLMDSELTGKLRALNEQLQLNDEEAVLLRMVFIDGINKSKAARALGKPGHHGGRVINDALKRIHDAFSACELDMASLYKAVS